MHKQNKYANGICVQQPDGTVMQSSHTSLLALPELPLAMRKIHIFPQMHNKALLSLGNFCDNEYEIKLIKQRVCITHYTNPSLSLYGNRDEHTGIWTVDITSQKCIQTKQEKIHSYIPSQGCVQPHTINLVQINRGRFPNHLARIDRRHGAKSSTQVDFHHKRTS